MASFENYNHHFSFHSIVVVGVVVVELVIMWWSRIGSDRIASHRTEQPTDRPCVHQHRRLYAPVRSPDTHGSMTSSCATVDNAQFFSRRRSRKDARCRCGQAYPIYPHTCPGKHRLSHTNRWSMQAQKRRQVEMRCATTPPVYIKKRVQHRLCLAHLLSRLFLTHLTRLSIDVRSHLSPLHLSLSLSLSVIPPLTLIVSIRSRIFIIPLFERCVWASVRSVGSVTPIWSCGNNGHQHHRRATEEMESEMLHEENAGRHLSPSLAGPRVVGKRRVNKNREKKVWQCAAIESSIASEWDG